MFAFRDAGISKDSTFDEIADYLDQNYELAKWQELTIIVSV
jgi:hypothetical protein